MSEVVGEAVIELTVDDKGVVTGIRQAGAKAEAASATAGDKSGKKFGSGFGGSAKKIIGVAALGIAAGIGVAAVGLRAAFGEAEEARKVGAKTVQLIKTTGAVANVSAKQVSDLAGALSDKAGMDDELIQSGANLLLTFKNIRNEAGRNNDVFNQATAAAVDLSAAGFGSVESASVMLGKALNDPKKGITALGRAGVTFSEDQKKAITKMAETGDMLGAQKAILKEVKGQVGGVAEAQATAADKAKVAWGNLLETIGTAAMPAFDALANAFTNVIAPALTDAINGLGPLFKRLRGFFGGGVDTGGISRAGAIFQAVSANIIAAGKAIWEALGPGVMRVIRGYRDLAAAAVDAGGKIFVALIPVFTKVAEIIRENVWPLLRMLADLMLNTVIPAVLSIYRALVQALVPVFQSLAKTVTTSILPAVQKLYIALLPIIKVLIAIVKFLVPIIAWFVRLAITVLKVVLPPLIKIIGFLLGTFIRVLALVITIVVRVVTDIITTFRGLWRAMNVIGKAINSGIRATWNAVKRVVTVVMGAIKNAVVGGWNAIRNTTVRVAGAIRSVVSSAFGAWRGIVSRAVGAVVSLLGQLVGKVRGFAGKMLTAAKSVGKAIIDGILAGLRAAGGFVSSLTSSIKSAINNALGLPVHIKGPGPLPDFNIPAFAKGGVARGGFALVGEEGPELVNLPAGSRVSTAAQTRQATAGAANVSRLPGKVILRVGHRDFVAYVQEIADERIDAADSLAWQGA